MKPVPPLLSMMIAGGPSEEDRAAFDAEVSRIAQKAERQAFIGASIDYRGYVLIVSSSQTASDLAIKRSGEGGPIFEETRPGRHLMRDFGDLRAWVDSQPV